MNLSEVLSLRQFLGLILFLNLFAAGCRTSSAAPAADLASDGRCMMPVVVGQNASDNVQKHANQLAEYLGRMGGTEFRVKRGDGSSGIVVGLRGDFESYPFEVKFQEGPFHREDYLLRSNAEGLWILGSTELAVRHGVWDVLHRLGHRQFFPGDTWEVVPRKDDLSIAVDCTESPDFCARRIWYNWGMRWGYNREPYSQWNARNRMARGFLLRSGHAYGRIIRGHRKEFEKHPEYYALVNGKRKKGGGAKLCVSNPGLQKLVVDYAVERFKKKPDMDSISLEPSDGGGWCECEDCKELGSPSDRALLLANKAAKAVNKLGFGEKYIGMYAYNRHSPPPSIKVHPNVIISVTTAFHTGGWNTKKIIEGWRDQGATLGIYDYFSVVAWDWNLPRRAKASRPHRIAPAIREFYRHGARFYDCESGDCWGPCGPGYYVASRVMWDVNEADRIDEIIDDFLQKAFGPAREPMAEFYHLITEDKRRRSPADLVGRMYRHLAEARRKAGENEAVKRRINDLILYTRYVELYEAYAAVAGEAKKEAKKAVLKHAYRIRERMMVHSYGLWARLIGQKAAHTKGHPLKDDRPIGENEILEILRKGIANNEPVEIGFEPVEFSRKLVPARGLKLRQTRRGNFPPRPQDRQNYYVWVEGAPKDIHLKVTCKKVWAKRPHHITLFRRMPDGEKVVDETGKVKPDGKTYDVAFKVRKNGLYRLKTRDGGDYTHIEWPDGMEVVAPTSKDTPAVKNHFRGRWNLYFYVPKGTKIVGGWASRIANWAHRCSGTMLDAEGNTVYDFARAGDGWFAVPVPEGQDGKLWKFANSHGQRLLMTVPPYLARSSEELLLPEEIVEADGPPN